MSSAARSSTGARSDRASSSTMVRRTGSPRAAWAAASSLALGATLAVAAFMTGQWLLLPVVGIVFVAETVSVIMQVLYFRWTGGRRIFRMTPLHHHFELQDGWSETQVTMRFWIIGMMAGLVGVALALL